jgi:hypothetical protein
MLGEAPDGGDQRSGNDAETDEAAPVLEQLVEGHRAVDEEDAAGEQRPLLHEPAVPVGEAIPEEMGADADQGGDEEERPGGGRCQAPRFFAPGGESPVEGRGEVPDQGLLDEGLDTRSARPAAGRGGRRRGEND